MAAMESALETLVLPAMIPSAFIVRSADEVSFGFSAAALAKAPSTPLVASSSDDVVDDAGVDKAVDDAVFDEELVADPVLDDVVFFEFVLVLLSTLSNALLVVWLALLFALLSAVCFTVFTRPFKNCACRLLLDKISKAAARNMICFFIKVF